jgi:hypothetical protein
VWAQSLVGVSAGTKLIAALEGLNTSMKIAFSFEMSYCTENNRKWATFYMEKINAYFLLFI